MGKGTRERAKRRLIDHLQVNIIDESTRHPDRTLDDNERLVLLNVITRAANRRGVVTGLVGVKGGLETLIN